MKHCSGCHAEIADDQVDCGKHDERPTPQAAREVSSVVPPPPPAGKHLFTGVKNVMEKVGHVALETAEVGADIALNSRTNF
jgi:hypothetical protein